MFSYLGNLFKKGDELDKFFKHILKKDVYISQETLKEFKILFVKYGSDKVEAKFYNLFPHYKDYQLAILLVFFYLVVNWNKLRQI